MITCGFVGLGLIGGSIAKALRKNVPDVHIVAYDINRESVELAVKDGVVDTAADNIDASFASCDYVFLCAPVKKNDTNLMLLKDILPASCLITDVGSVKSEIHRTVAEAGLEDRFIGGHPMAGSERVGYVNSKEVLLENAYYILTPTATVPAEKLEAYKELVTAMGALPLVLDYKQHDYVTAAVSHLPHVIASSLVNLVRDHDSEDGIMKTIAAGGFKDITRIASSSAVMWQNICLTNTDNILSLLDDYIDSLKQVRSELVGRDGNEIYEFFDGARIYRDSFIGASSGPIKRAYYLLLDITDEPGALAAIATLLALNQISIKNMGINHNREYEGGVLRVEFYDEDSVEKAKKILGIRGYTIYEKH